MSSIHIATKTVVKVSIGSPSGNSVAVFVQRGGIVPEGVPSEQLERLVRQGFLEEIDTPEPDPEPTAFSQADLDAAVQAATEAQRAELEEARADATKAKAEAQKAKSDLEAATKPAKSSTARNATSDPATQS